jgi:hypothetical protein
MTDVHIDIGNLRLEQFRHELLTQPDGLILEPDLDLCLPVLGLVKDQLALVGGDSLLCFMAVAFQRVVQC